MKQNTFISFGILALLVLALNVVSASNLVLNQTSFGSSTQNVVQGSSAQFTVLVSNQNDTYNITGISFSGASISNLANGSAQSLAFTVSVPSNSALGVQTYTLSATGNLNGTTITSNSATVTLNVTQSSENQILAAICPSGINSSEISIGEIEDKTLDNQDEWEWEPLNNIEIRVNDVENRDANKDHDYEVSLLFYKSDGTKVSADKIAENEDDLVQDSVSIDSEDTQDATFNFQVSGQANDGTYNAYVKVKRSGVCYAEKLSNTISISKEDYKVVVQKADGPVTASCGETVQVSAEVANVGSNDEDRVRVNFYNKELGIDAFKEIDNLAEGDTSLVTFMFSVPSNAVQKLYRIALSTEYKYDDNKDSYKKTSDSAEDITYALNLIDGCVDPTKPTITATLDSSAQVGKDFNITITIKNNANSSNSFLLTAEGYDAWASSASFVPTAFNLAKQATQTVTLTLSPTQSGAKTFTLKTVYNGKTVEQVVGLNIASKKETAISNYFANMKDGNVTTWLVTGIVILIVLILIILLLRLLL